MGGITDKELADAVWAELKQVDRSWTAVSGYSKERLAKTHWGKGKALLDMIGKNQTQPPPAPPATGALGYTTLSAKPNARVVLNPNYEDSRDGGSDYQACWLGGPTQNLDISSSGIDNWLICTFKIDPSWPTGPNAGFFDSANWGNDLSSLQGRWGRLFNWHSTAAELYLYDVVGSSAFAVDYINGILTVNVEPEGPFSSQHLAAGNLGNYRITDVGKPGSDGSGLLTLGVEHTIVIHVRWGRTDGTTGGTPGSVTIWMDGNDTPCVSLPSVNTLYRYNPGGGYVNQRYFYCWNGFYTKDLHDTYQDKFEMSVAKRGASVAAALADSSTTFNAETIHGSSPVAWALGTNRYSSGLDYSLGPCTVTRIADKTSYLIPPSLL